MNTPEMRLGTDGDDRERTYKTKLFYMQIPKAALEDRTFLRKEIVQYRVLKKSCPGLKMTLGVKETSVQITQEFLHVLESVRNGTVELLAIECWDILSDDPEELNSIKEILKSNSVMVISYQGKNLLV